MQNSNTPENLETLDSLEHPNSRIESNIPFLARQIFSQPPGPPFSVVLQLEDANEIEDRSPEQAQTVFEILAHILLEGIKVKYGKDKDPRKLNPEQIQTINKYMNSIGFNTVINTYTLEQTMDDPEGYKKTDIEFYRLRMIDPELHIWHDIKIEYLKVDNNTPEHLGSLIYRYK
jgi:hypothetical protein